MVKEVLVLFEDWGDKIIIYFEKSKLFADYFLFLSLSFQIK